ncbi:MULTISPECIES: transposase [unclassified Pseudomonas]|uniref:transposase n=1 Tax=unclassified Pseudomonas TaxID=196821 RepID=UPI00131AFAD2
MPIARSVHDQARRRSPESFKREAVDQAFAGTPLRHVAETLGIAESLLGRWKRTSTNSKVTMPFRAMASSGARVRSCVAYASNWLRSPWSVVF